MGTTANDILIVFGIVSFIDGLFLKFEIYKLLNKWATKSPIKIIYELTLCRFCMLSHLGWIVTVLYGLFAGFRWDMILIVMCVSGLGSIFNQRE